MNYQGFTFQKSLINVNANHAEMRGQMSAEWVKFIPSTWEHLIGNAAEASRGFYEVIYGLMKPIEKAFIHIMIKTTSNSMS